MRFETSQHMRLGQHMKLAPRMIQSMEILQMPLTELEERIQQELESNATLEIVEDPSDDAEVHKARQEAERDAREGERPLEVDESSGTADFERLESYEQTHPDAMENEYLAPRAASELHEPTYSRARLDGERDGKMDAMAAAPARSASLPEQLLRQWALAEVDARTLALGELIISFLEDDGYLRTPLETISDRAPVGAGQRPSVEDLQLALGAVQSALEPQGIAARNVRESLLLQLDALIREQDDGDASLRTARLLVADHLDDLMHNRLPLIAANTGLTLDQIKMGLAQMRRLSLAPARRLVDRPQPPIIPDAIVEFDEETDRYIAYLNDSRVPNLRINKAYAQMSRDRAVQKKDRQFIRTNLANAQWLIDAVGQRRHTLLRVINVVVEAQRDFFDYGPQALRPLPMSQVAERLGIHVATVSRAVSEKYLQTPRGIVPLRRFFTGGLQTHSGEDISADAVKAALRDLIDAEDKAHPLSDEALLEELQKRVGGGVEIARRTVAKYRGQMGIPQARMRKTF